jgi:type I restriction enzyme S subunit
MTWELSEGWRWQTVGDALTPVRAQAKPDDIHDDWLYLGLEHVQGVTGQYEGVEAGSAGIKSNKFRFDPGDVLYGKLRPNLRKCVVAGETGVCSTDLVPLRPVRPEAAHFLALQLRSEPFTESVMRLIGGANLPRVNIKDLLKLELPVPPTADEDRLFEAARSASVLRDKLRLLHAAVTDIELAATAEVLGLAGQARADVRVFAKPVS